MLPSDESSLPAPPLPPPSKWQRLHPLSPIINVNVKLFLGLSVGAYLVGNGVGLAVVLVGNVSWRVLKYQRVSYRLVGNELTVRSGVFVQNVRTLPANRVQQVNLIRKLRHRAFNVWDVNVEIAGESDEAEVTLSVLSLGETERIRAGLSAARRTPSPDTEGRSVPVEAPACEEIYRQRNGHLIRWAVVSSLNFTAILFGGTPIIIKMARSRWDRQPTDATAIFSDLGVEVITVIIFIAVLTLINIVQYWNLRLERAGDELRMLYGLLTRRSVEVPLERVQALVESLSLPGRMLGIVSVTAHNASGTTDGNSTYLPAVPVADRRDLTGHLAPGFDVEAPLRQHPTLARRLAIFKRVVLATIFAVLLIAIFRNIWSLSTLVLIPLAVPWGWRAWVVLGHGETDDVVIGRRGVWKEVTGYVRRDRVQSAAVTANWFQRRLGLATLRIDVAQPLGKVKIVDMATHEADRLLDQLVRVSENET